MNTIELILVSCLETPLLYPLKGSAKELSLGFNWFLLIIKLSDNENLSPKGKVRKHSRWGPIDFSWSVLILYT